MSASSSAPSFDKYFGDERIEAAREVVQEVVIGGAYKVTKYLSDKLTVKATRKMFKGKFLKKSIDIILTIGPPNYEERETIKRAKSDGYSPVEMTIKMPPKMKGEK
jgi:hypothetical protein